MQAPLTTKNHRFAFGSTLAELPLTLTILIFFVVMPLIDLVGLATGACTAYLLAHETASRASQQRRYADAVDSIQTTAATFNQSGLSRFAKMVPVGGYGGSGVDLYVDASNFRTNMTNRFGPNSPVPAPIDLSSWVYECTTQATFEIGPTIDLSFVPFLGLVPGLGKPALLTYYASRAAEHATGLEQSAPPGGNSGGSVSPLNQTPSQTNFSGVLQSGWDLPNIYELIAAAGQTVVTEQVVIVDSTNSNWTDTGINVASGQKVWIDLRSDGLWTIYPLTPVYNANGDLRGIYIPNMRDQAQPPGSLLGKVGNSPMFKVGVNYLNYAPSYTGEVMLVMNDDNIDVPGYADNVGKQVVRIILTQ
jgi:uncharacterized membrane protein